MTRLSSLIDKGFNSPYDIADNTTYYIPTNSIIMYSGASNPGLDSQGWTYTSQYNGYYIRGATSGIGSLTAQSGGSGAVVTLTVGSAGSHTGNVAYQVLNSFPATQSTGNYLYQDHGTSGAHIHAAQAGLDYNSSDINPPTRGYILLKSTKNTTLFPPGSILISGNIISGSTQLVGSATYTYIKGNSTPTLVGATSRTMTAYAATDIGVSGTSRPGFHSHNNSTSGILLYGRTLQVYGGTAPNGGMNTGIYNFETADQSTNPATPWPPASSGMFHTHTISSGYISCTSLTGKIVKLWQIAQYTVPESAVVIMYSGAIADLPRYWKVCDGNNGTINMNGYFLGYSNSSATAHDTTTIKNINSTSVTLGTELWIHAHTQGAAYNQAQGSIGWPFPIYHAPYQATHTHTISNGSVSVNYDPPTVDLCFIQFTPDVSPTAAVNIPNIVSITPSATSVDEGSTLTFNVSGWEYPNASTLYWTIETNSSDFNTTSGSFIINNNTGSFSVTPTIDQLTEGSETFTVAVRSGSASGTILLTSSPVTINDTSLTPTYSISTTSTVVNEGTTVTYTVITTNLPDGYTLYYSNSGTTTAADFSDVVNSGSFTITNNTATITKTLVNDLSFSEGSETITMQVRTGSTSGTVVATASTITVLDTSYVTYSVSPDITTVNEGSTVTFTITTQNIANGTTLYYTNSGTTTAADFSDALNSGSFTITNNTATITKTLVNDLSNNEGSETLIIQLRTGSTSGTVVATTSTVTVLDTSFVTYSVVPNVTTVNEGSTVTFTITTQNIANGTTLYYTNSGTTTAADFTDALNSGSVTIINNTATITKTLVNDVSTNEGSESISIQLRTGSTSGTVVTTASTVTVLDTSIQPVPKIVSARAGQDFATSTVSVGLTIKPNDIILAFVSFGGPGAAPVISNINSTISGAPIGTSWTKRAEIAASSTGNKVAGYYYWAKSSVTGTGSYTWTFTSTATVVTAVMVVVEGCNATSPFGVGGPYSQAQAPVTPAVTNSVALTTDRANVLSIAVLARSDYDQFGDFSGNAPISNSVAWTPITGGEANAYTGNFVTNNRQYVYSKIYSSQISGEAVPARNNSTTAGRYMIIDNLVI